MISRIFNIKYLIINLLTCVISGSYEYDGMHPHLQSILIGKAKRAMPPMQFEPPIREEEESYWHEIGQNILKQQLKKNYLNTNIAKNLILFIGDGLSIPTITAARVYIGGEEQQLSFEKFPYVGLSKTYCANTQVADSACSATAYLGGVKSNYQTIGLTAGAKFGVCEDQKNSTNHVRSIAYWAQEQGMATGFVTTTKVTDASPSGIYAHTANRYWENDGELLKGGGDPRYCMDIAKQLIYNPVGNNLKIIMGGGRMEFIPETQVDISGNKGKRTDNLNLIEAWKEKHKNKSSAYIQTRNELLNLPENTEYVMGLFNSSHLPFHLDLDTDTPTLTEMVEKALDILESKHERYFLFVEGGLIDHAHHNTEAVRAIDETIEFERAIDLARRRTSDKDTLIIVTADHSHTMSMAGYSSRKNDIFGINNGQIGTDQLPYATLSYANGPGFERNMKTTEGKRRNLREVKMNDKDYKFPSAVPLESETHGGDDVPVFASGPWAHLFTGVYEQNYIPNAMSYAACIGLGLTACNQSNS